MSSAPTVADCERVQTAWFCARATALGGRVWRDGDLLWTDGPDGTNLMFPREMDPAAIRRGVEQAGRSGRPIVGAWLGLEVDARPLESLGFERGWSPWWMARELVGAPEPSDPRIELKQDSTDYRGEFAGYRAQLALARLEPIRAWYAAAYCGGRFAGHAWSFLDGTLAGVFDMAVWEAFRRRGLGTGLLHAVCGAARAAGARHAVLNATPEGKLLYAAVGFTQIGAGITWWLHPG